jgi:hypothetical protein
MGSPITQRALWRDAAPLSRQTKDNTSEGGAVAGRVAAQERNRDPRLAASIRAAPILFSARDHGLPPNQNESIGLAAAPSSAA